jgi:hypothetical protein
MVMRFCYLRGSVISFAVSFLCTTLSQSGFSDEMLGMCLSPDNSPLSSPSRKTGKCLNGQQSPIGGRSPNRPARANDFPNSPLRSPAKKTLHFSSPTRAEKEIIKGPIFVLTPLATQDENTPNPLYALSLRGVGKKPLPRVPDGMQVYVTIIGPSSIHEKKLTITSTTSAWINVHALKAADEKYGEKLSPALYKKLEEASCSQEEDITFFVKAYLEKTFKQVFVPPFLAALEDQKLAPGPMKPSPSKAKTRAHENQEVQKCIQGLLPAPNQHVGEVRWQTTDEMDIMCRILPHQHQILTRRGPLIGKGSFKDVYPATLFTFFDEGRIQTEPERQDALVELYTQKGGNVKTEVQLHSTLQHPNIMPAPWIIFDGQQQESKRTPDMSLLQLRAKYSLMSYLKQLATDNKTAAIVKTGTEIAAALQYLHVEKRLIYRDLKPDNILYGLRTESIEFDRAMLCDFGLTISMNAANTDREGSPFYLPPFEEEKTTNDPSMDLWALGVSLYEMLSPSGKLPPCARPSTVDEQDPRFDPILFADWTETPDHPESQLRAFLIKKLLVPKARRATAKEAILHLEEIFLQLSLKE